MAKYIVQYTHVVENEYEAIVEANSPEEAKNKIGEGDIVSEELIQEQGIEFIIDSVLEEEE